jgi:cobalt/nickel transport system permease protein
LCDNFENRFHLLDIVPMSHIHIPDGILPFWLWIAGYLIVILYLIGLGVYFKKHPHNKKLALIGIFAALMIIAMSIELVPIGYHINLAALTGIILGPLFSVLSIFVVTLILGLIGHGGITVVGLNTLTISLEAIVAWAGFRFLKNKIKNLFLVTFLSTVIALFISTWGTIGIVYLGSGNLENIMHNHGQKSEKVFNFHLFDKHKDHEHENLKDHGKAEHLHEHTDSSVTENLQQPATPETPQKLPHFSMQRFILLVMILGLIGWVLEGLITAFIINYIYKTKPDLLE